MTKEHSTTPSQPQPESNLAITSLVLGIVSLAGPGLLLGIPAIITGAIALKRNHGGRGLSIAGLVTGTVSTVLSILFLAFITLVILWSLSPSAEIPGYSQPYSETEQLPQGSHT